MADPQAALATQLRNIEARTGETLPQLRIVIEGSGLTKHSEIRAMLMQRYSLGHGDANTLAHLAKADPAQAAADDVLDSIYSGKKAELRPLHELVMARIAEFGEFEIAPKKAYLSLRRKRQFAMVGPATQTQVEVGLNVKSLPADARLKALPAGGMCQYAVRLSTPAEVDKKLVAWLRTAYDAAG